MKIVVRLLVLLTLLWVEGVWAVDCPSADYDLYEQADVDAFPQDCDVVTGSVRLTSEIGATNLAPLSNLRQIGGDLEIRYQQLTNLDGLESLESVGGALIIEETFITDVDGLASLQSAHTLTIFDNDALTNLDGLSALSSVDFWVNIQLNDALRDLDGLVGLTRTEHLYINFNSALLNIDGLAGADITRTVLVRFNQSLTNIDGLIGVTSARELKINLNDSLQNIDGIGNLQTVDNVEIYGNGLLVDIDPLISLTSVGSSGGTVPGGWGLLIDHNPSLVYLDGLANLQLISGDLTVTNNSQLGICEGLAPVLGYASETDFVNGEIDIGNNWVGGGCNSVEEILDSVTTPSAPLIYEVTPRNGGADVVFGGGDGESVAYPVLDYVARCGGSTVGETWGGVLPISPSLNRTLATLELSGFGASKAETAFIVSWEIQHERPDLLTATLIAPSGARYILRDGLPREREYFTEFIFTEPALLARDSHSAPPDWVLLDDPEGSADLRIETVDGFWHLEIVNSEGPILREGSLLRFSIDAQEQPVAVSLDNDFDAQVVPDGSQPGNVLTLANMVNGRTYNLCFMWPRTSLGVHWESSSEAFSVTPTWQPPAGLSITSVEYGDGYLVVGYLLADDGGLPLDMVISVDCESESNLLSIGNVTLSGDGNGGASGTIRFRNAVEGSTYTCSASVANSLGATPSATYPPVLAEEVFSGLPIWLLYQINQ